ncbi:MAG: ABC transporter permease [Dehalococcoidia bacterium]|nr:MAG: ABC transporter permease [Dehalococcoidia bacterium]
MTDFFSAIIQLITQRKLSSFLAVISLSVGVVAFVCITALEEGVLSLGFIDNDQLAVNPSITLDFSSEPLGQRLGDRIEEIVETIRSEMHRKVAYRESFGRIDAKLGRISVSNVSVIAISGNTYKEGFLRSDILLRGRLITTEDDDAGNAVCLISSKLADTIAPDQDPIDKVIRLSGYRFKIIGLIDSDSSTNPYVVIPYTTAKVNLPEDIESESRKAINVFSTKETFWKDLDTLDILLNRITQMNHDWHTCCLGSWLKSKYLPNKKGTSIHFSSQWLSTEKVRAGQNKLRMLIGFLAALCLTSGALGLVNMLLANLASRKHEIGIYRALGATRSRIASEVICLAMSIGLISGIAGVILSLYVIHCCNMSFDLPFIISKIWLIAAIAVSVLTGFLAGCIPARYAMKVSPAENLQG